MVLRARGSDFRLPLGSCGRPRPLPASPSIGDGDGRSRGRAAVLRAGRRDRHRQAAVMVTVRVPSETREGRPGAGDPGVRHHPPGAAGAGGLAAVLAGGAGRDGEPPATTGSRCTSCWSSRASTACSTRRRRSRRSPGGRRPTSWTPWLAKVTEQGSVAGSVRAAGGHQPAAHADPLPAAAGPGRDRGEAAGEKLLEDAPLTELAGLIAVSCMRGWTWAATLRAHGHRWGWGAGSAVAGGFPIWCG